MKINLNKWTENLSKEEETYLNKIKSLNHEIKLYEIRIVAISDERPSTVVNDNGFYNLRVHSSLSYHGDFIGIYIIWNKNHNKYYVGQSINDNGFYNLRVHSSLSYHGDFIGIYIIWNKNHNKYYVGQSINQC